MNALICLCFHSSKLVHNSVLDPAQLKGERVEDPDHAVSSVAVRRV